MKKLRTRSLFYIIAPAMFIGVCVSATPANSQSPAASTATATEDAVLTQKLVQGSPWSGSIVIGSSYANATFAFHRGKDGTLEGEFIGLSSVASSAVPADKLNYLKVVGKKVTFTNNGAPYQLEYTVDGRLDGHFIGVTGSARGQKGYVKLAPQGN